MPLLRRKGRYRHVSALEDERAGRESTNPQEKECSVKPTTHVKISGLCLTGLCLMAVFAFGAAGSASAKTLLFVPEGTAKFPVHFAGSGPASLLETTSGKKIQSKKVDILAVILNSTLFDVHLRFLETFAEGLEFATCSNTANAGEILANVLGHLGLTHPGDKPGVLLLVDGSILFTCFGTEIHAKGAIIGEITHPEILKPGQKLIGFKFTQTNGVQNVTQFLLGNELLVNQFQQASFLPEGYLQFGQSGSALLHILEGSFQIIDE
jgi:hypothetical protein